MTTEATPSLKISAYLVIVHGIMTIFLTIFTSPNLAYMVGMLFGKIFWISIVVWALLKTVKTGWWVAMVYITVTILIAGVYQWFQYADEAGANAANIPAANPIVAVLVNGPLFIAFAYLLQPSSRAAFNKIHKITDDLNISEKNIKNIGSTYFSVSPLKFAIMNICTIGLYVLYWFYKNWHHIKQKNNSNIMPFWRAFFSPLWAYSCFKQIFEEPTLNQSHNAGVLALAYFFSCASARLPEPYWLLSLFTFIFIYPANDAVTKLNQMHIHNFEQNSKITGWNWLAVVTGVIILVVNALYMFGVTIDNTNNKKYLAASSYIDTQTQYMDYEKYYEAAIHGDAHSQHMIGIMYRDGKGVQKDISKAYAWLGYAAANGVEIARNERAVIESTLNPEELEEALNFARELREVINEDKTQ